MPDHQARLRKLMEEACFDPSNWIEFAERNLPLVVQHPELPDYFVTIDGRVRGARSWLIPRLEKTGYLSVTLRQPGREHAGATSIARLVGSAFLGIPLRAREGAHYLVVNHLDGRKNVNVVPNLSACSPAGNQRHVHRFALTSAFENAARETARAAGGGLGSFCQEHLDLRNADDLAAIAGVTVPVARRLLASRSQLRQAEAADVEGERRRRDVVALVDACKARLTEKREEIANRAMRMARGRHHPVERLISNLEAARDDFSSNADTVEEKVPGLGPCREWRGALNRGGYGSRWLAGKQVGAHVAAYFLFNATDAELRHWSSHGAEKLDISHSCHNPRCVEPRHLTRETRKDHERIKERAGRNPKGMNRWNAKADDRAVSVILWMAGSGLWTQETIARHVVLSQPTVSEIIAGRKRRGIGPMTDEEAAAVSVPPPDRNGADTVMASGERNAKAVMSAQRVRLLRYMKTARLWSMRAIAKTFPEASRRTCYKVAAGEGYPGCPAFTSEEAKSYIAQLPAADLDPLGIGAPKASISGAGLMWKTKISDEQVAQLKWMLASGRWNSLTLAGRFNLSPTQVSEIKNGTSRRWVETATDEVAASKAATFPPDDIRTRARPSVRRRQCKKAVG